MYELLQFRKGGGRGAHPGGKETDQGSDLLPSKKIGSDEHYLSWDLRGEELKKRIRGKGESSKRGDLAKLDTKKNTRKERPLFVMCEKKSCRIDPQKRTPKGEKGERKLTKQGEDSGKEQRLNAQRKKTYDCEEQRKGLTWHEITHIRLKKKKQNTLKKKIISKKTEKEITLKGKGGCVHIKKLVQNRGKGDLWRLGVITLATSIKREQQMKEREKPEEGKKKKGKKKKKRRVNTVLQSCM